MEMFKEFAKPINTHPSKTSWIRVSIYKVEWTHHETFPYSVGSNLNTLMNLYYERYIHHI